MDENTMSGFWNSSLPEIKMNTFEIVRYYGYPAAEYDVTTDDGYIITIQRIPYGKHHHGKQPRKPVIIQHGFMLSSVIWVLNTPANSLGFVLADAGYDVWLTNVRGNTYGRRHLTLNPKQNAFWEFSFDEMAKYDMPAIIDFILFETGYNSVYYIGYSMGTTIAFAMLSSKPEYNEKICCVMALAPVISTRHLSNPLALAKPYQKEIRFLAGLVGEFEFLPRWSLNTILANVVYSLPIKHVYESVQYLLGKAESSGLDMARLPVYISHIPAGASTRTFLHYIQLMVGGFRRFDYGPALNLKKYRSPAPPFYDMTKMVAPVALFCSENDLLANPKDVAILESRVTNLLLKYDVPYAKFTHEDFFWARNAKSLLYDKLLEEMQKL